jgi:hypothetical protein
LFNLPNDFGKKLGRKIMGGMGSGRRSSYSGKGETADAAPLDIRKLARQGLLTPGHSFSWHWTINDTEVSAISITANLGSVTLAYRRTSTNEDIRQVVAIESTACHLGGERQWFVCQGCSKRVAVIYGVSKYFGCRRCYALVYPSQKESPGDRAARKADRIRKRLGWPIGILNDSLGKPKGMHWLTYWRLKRHHDALVQVSFREMEARFGLQTQLEC